MLCIIGAGSKLTELDKAIEKYKKLTEGRQEQRIRKEYSLDAKTDKIKSSLTGVFNNFHIQQIIEKPTLRDIYNLLSYPEGKAILPNPPLDENLYDSFRRQNEILADKPRTWVQFDIDWPLLEGQTMAMPLQTRIDFALNRLGVPAAVGYVGQISSSGWITDERKTKRELSIRLYFLLENPMTQLELQRAFQDVDVDSSMFECGRLHIIDYPSVADEDIDTLETNEDVFLKNGDKLDPTVLPKTKTNTQEFNPATPGQKEKLKENINQPNLFSLMRKEGLDYRDPLDHIAYYEKNADYLDGRNMLFYETLKVCYNLNGSFEPFYSEWHKKREDASYEVWKKIRGQHKPNYLNAKIKAVKKEFLEDTTCGNIKNTFKSGNKTIVHLNTDYIYEDTEKVDRELAEWEKNGGVLLLKAGCGSGKTSFVLDKVYHIANKPKRYCFITFRKSLISQTISKCQKKGKTFNPHHYETLGEYNELQQGYPVSETREPSTIARRKRQYLPVWNNPILCVDSLHYLEDNGIENPFEVVFIDEIEHVLEGLWQEGDMNDYDSIMDSRKSRWLQLIKICSKAKYVVLADDKASNSLTGWFVDEVINYSNRKSWLLYNEKDLLTKKTIIDISNKATGYHLYKIKKLVKDDKVVALQTNRKVESLRNDIYALTAAGIQKHQIFAIDSKVAYSSFKEEYTIENGNEAHLANDYRKNPNKVIPWLIEKGVKVFIHSPWNGVGWDYDGEGIDAVFVKLLPLPKIDSKDSIQYMSRFRLCDLIYIALPIKDANK